MSDERNESLDILPVGMSERFTEYLEDVQKKMTELVEGSDKLARMLDDKDDSEENQQFAKLFKTMADSANQIIGVVKDAANDGVEKLEDKNRVVGSSYQGRCIDEIQSGAGSLSEQDFTECHLNGDSPQVFSAADRVAFESAMDEMIDLWVNYSNELGENAMALSSFSDKNELSEVCEKIAEQILEIADGSQNTMEAVRNRMGHVDTQRQENTEAINAKAESDIAAVQQEMTNILKGIEDAISVI